MRKASRWWGLLASTAMAAAVGCSSTSSGKPDEASAMGWAPGEFFGRRGHHDDQPRGPDVARDKLPTPGPDLFVATAHMYESTNSFEDAAAQYERALRVDPGYLPALLGYAQWHDAGKNVPRPTSST